MGSVKDLTIVRKPGEKLLGSGIFTFSDRYSVFDWGEMPDHIPGKGQALNMMSAWNFTELAKRGIKSHFLSVYEENASVPLDLSKPSSVMKVLLTKVISIENDYAHYRKFHPHYLIPLEIIFRNGLPKGSSVFKKIAGAGSDPAKLKNILEPLGLTEVPQPGSMLPRPVYDFTTKLETSDRPLTEAEAERISGLSSDKFRELIGLAEKVNTFITETAESRGFLHYDGKIEAMFVENDIVLVDVLGTFDENRFLFQDEQVSKEILRQAYLKLQPEFPKAVDEAKKEAAAQGRSDWKALCRVQPKPLPPKFIDIVSNIYKAGANRYLDHEVFPGIAPLETLVTELAGLRDSLP